MHNSYGQFCPIARASEILAERWTPIIVRNLLIGCNTFTEIEKGAPGISKTLLTDRLRRLERYSLVVRRPSPGGRGSVYELTDAGRDLGEVLNVLGTWGQRWLEIAPEHLDPGIALWAMTRNLNVSRLPRRRLTLRFAFTGKPKMTLWVLIEHGAAEICRKSPGGEDDVVVTAESDWFVRWRSGHASWSEAAGGGHIRVEGRSDLTRDFLTWFKPERFAQVPRSSGEAAATAVG